MIRYSGKINLGKVIGELGVLLILAQMLVYLNNAVGDEQGNTSIIQVGIALVMCLLVWVVSSKGKVRISPFIIWAGVLCVVMLIVSYVCNGLSFGELFRYFMKFFLWLFAYLIGYIAVKNYSCEKFIRVSVVVAYIIMMTMFFSSLYMDFSVKNKNYVVTAVYYLLCCMPFLLEVENKIVRNVLLVTLVLGVILSFKRSALLVLLCVILVLALSELKQANNKKMMQGIIFGCSLCIAAIIYLAVEAPNNEMLSNIFGVWNGRFGEENSRTAIIERVIDLITKSNVLNILFGHGYNAVLQDSGFSLSAHNDYLEILYNYGILGFLLFVAMIVSLLRKIKTVGINNIRRRRGNIVSLTIFLVASIPSHMLTYSTYFLLLSLYWGYAHGHEERLDYIDKGANKCV